MLPNLKEEKFPKNKTLLLHLHRESDSRCLWSALLTLFVIASLFSISQGLHRGGRLSHFISFLVFLPQQRARGLRCGCKHGGGTCTHFRETEKWASRSHSHWKQALCVCLEPAVPRPASRDHLADLRKLGFLSLYLAKTIFWRWSSLFLLAGRKIACKFRGTCSGVTPVLAVTGATVVRDRKGWLTLPDSTSRCRVASPGAEVSTTGKKGHEDRGIGWRLSGRMQFRSCRPNRSSLPFLFSVFQRSLSAPTLHRCSCVLGSAGAGAAGGKISPPTEALGPSSMAALNSFNSQRSGGGAGGWRMGGPPQPSASKKAALKLHVLRQGEGKLCIGVRGREPQAVHPAAWGKQGPCPLPSPEQADPA